MYTAGLVSTTRMLLVFLIFGADLPLSRSSMALVVDVTVVAAGVCLFASAILIMFGQCWRHLVKNGFVTPMISAGLFNYGWNFYQD